MGNGIRLIVFHTRYGRVSTVNVSGCATTATVYPRALFMKQTAHRVEWVDMMEIGKDEAAGLNLGTEYCRVIVIVLSLAKVEGVNRAKNNC